MCSELSNKDEEEEAKTDKKEEKSKKDSKEDKKKSSKTEWGISRQAIAVIGISLISMGEEIGSEMAFRSFGHLVRVQTIHCVML